MVDAQTELYEVNTKVSSRPDSFYSPRTISSPPFLTIP